MWYKMWAQVSFVLAQSTRLTDGQTDRRIFTVCCITMQSDVGRKFLRKPGLKKTMFLEPRFSTHIDKFFQFLFKRSLQYRRINIDVIVR